MKKTIKKMFLGMIFCLSLSSILYGTITVKAASKIKAVCTTDKNKSFSVDVTGDNKKDKITLKIAKDSYNGPVKKIQVYVKGQKALTLNDKCGSRSVSVYYIRMSKSKTFLQIITHHYNTLPNYNNIYRYNTKTKKLVKVLDLSNVTGNPGKVMNVSGNQIKIEYIYQPTETGWLEWKYTYNYKNGKFKLKSNTVPVKSSLGSGLDNYDRYFKQNKFVVAKTRKFYTTTSLKKVAFTAEKNEVLTLENIKISGKNVYLQFKSGKKIGWQKMRSSYNWFYGVTQRLAG